MSHYLPETGGVPAILRLFCRFPILLIVVAVGFGAYFVWPEAMPADCVPEVLGVVSFAFDDGYESTYTEAFPVLERYGYTGTVYVVTSAVSTTGYMNLDQLHELSDAGWEIGSHTVSHPDLTLLDPCDVELELAVSKAWLEGAGFTVNTFASPFGEYRRDTLELIKQHYTTHRTAWPDGINSIPLAYGEDYELKCVLVYSDTTVEEVKAWIDRAIEERGWLILAFHRIGEEGDYNWTAEQLEEVVRYVRDANFWMVSESFIEEE